MRMAPRLSFTIALTLLASLAAEPVAAQQTHGDDLVVGEVVVGRRVAPQPGEICLVCNKPVGTGDAAYKVEGRRVAVHAANCDHKLRANARAFLAQLTPRGAFLGADGRQPSALSLAWFWVGAYVFVGLFFAALCAHRALQTGHNPFAWFAAGLALNAFAYFALLTRPRRELAAPAGIPGGLGKIASTRAPLPCPQCGATNHPAAGECLGCGAKLTPHALSEVRGPGLRAN